MGNKDALFLGNKLVISEWTVSLLYIFLLLAHLVDIKCTVVPLGDNEWTTVDYRIQSIETYPCYCLMPQSLLYRTTSRYNFILTVYKHALYKHTW